jgi:hypothetical protein
VTSAKDPGLPESGMATGSDAGEPGERRPVDLEDLVAAAAEDETTLPPPPEYGGGGNPDGADVEFREPLP